MLNVIDNQESKAIKTFITEEGGQCQFIEPGNHRANAAERAVQTFKDHFIAGLCTTDEKFPAQLWDYQLPQAQDTLNLLRASRKDPTTSAYEVMDGNFYLTVY